MCVVLGYGGFDFNDPVGDAVQAILGLIVILLAMMVAYLPASALAHCRGWWRLLAPGVFIVMFMTCVAPQMQVMGARGPGHVAMEVGLLSAPMLLGLVVAKALFPLWFVRRKEQASERVLCDDGAQESVSSA